ncbi:transcriptional regulator [Halobacteriales archaeon QH_10_67_22]|nr:MAG: transcriptional regulator [Halobacteriales archaeon QH_10_67_22]
MGTNTTRLDRLLAEQLEECCAGDTGERIETLESLSDSADAGGDLQVLSALSDDTRYRLASLLAAADGELCVCELTAVVDVSDSATSHALGDLHDAGLVTRRKDGQWRYYDATERTERVLDALDETRGER